MITIDFTETIAKNGPKISPKNPKSVSEVKRSERLICVQIAQWLVLLIVRITSGIFCIHIVIRFKSENFSYARFELSILQKPLKGFHPPPLYVRIY